MTGDIVCVFGHHEERGFGGGKGMGLGQGFPTHFSMDHVPTVTPSPLPRVCFDCCMHGGSGVNRVLGPFACLFQLYVRHSMQCSRPRIDITHTHLYLGPLHELSTITLPGTRHITPFGWRSGGVFRHLGLEAPALVGLFGTGICKQNARDFNVTTVGIDFHDGHSY